jgi:hypothetical protein
MSNEEEDGVKFYFESTCTDFVIIWYPPILAEFGIYMKKEELKMKAQVSSN